MSCNKFTTIYLSFAVVLLLVSGCVSVEKDGKLDTLEKDVSSLNQLIKEKEAKIEKLQELLDDQQQQLRELNDKLLECSRKNIEKTQPNLK